VEQCVLNRFTVEFGVSQKDGKFSCRRSMMGLGFIVFPASSLLKKSNRATVGALREAQAR